MVEREFNYCLRCGRKLKKPESRILGYGKICYEKSKEKEGARLFHVKNNTPLQEQE